MGGLVTPHAHEPDDSGESLGTVLLVVLMDSPFRRGRQIRTTAETRLESLRCILLQTSNHSPLTSPPIEFPKTDTVPYPPVFPYCMNFHLHRPPLLTHISPYLLSERSSMVCILYCYASLSPMLCLFWIRSSRRLSVPDHVLMCICRSAIRH